METQHLVATTQLLRAAANRGVFKLEHYNQVFQMYSECNRLISDNTGKKVVDVPKQSVTAILSVLVYAANNNGFDISAFGNVNLLRSVLETYLKQSEDAGKAEEKAE